MIPVKSDMSKVDHLPGETVEFSIGDARWVMRSMADLYSNRELAVCREYSTNAYDAGKEKALAEGSDIPAIEVTLPTVLDPHFRVRDFGYGMSTDVLKEVYTKFGESTKRDSNDFNGMLGFGSKSAVAYTNTFTVTSIHEGTKTIAVISRQPDWSIVMKIVSVSKTNEPSGTEVSVPVHNSQEFAHKAKDFYKFWAVGSVKVNGTYPKQHVGEKITDNFYHSNDWDASYIVMGNVPYRIENPRALFRTTSMNHINFVAYVENGGVEFTPNREALKYSDHTKAELQRIIDNFESAIVDKAKNDIASATTHQEAFAAWYKWTQNLGSSMFANLEFKGERFISRFYINAYNYRTNGYRGSSHNINHYNVEAMPKTMVVTEFDLTMSSSVKDRAKQYAKQMDWEVTNILFTKVNEKSVVSPWIPRDKFVTWEDLKAALPKVPRKKPVPGGKTRISGTYDYWTKAGFFTEKTVPTTGEVMYVTVQKSKAYDIQTILKHLNSDATVIILGQNRLAKFNRENPSAKEFTDYVRGLVVVDAKTLLSDDAKTVMAIDSNTRRWISRLSNYNLDDPEVNTYAALIKTEDALLKAYNDNSALARLTKRWYDVKEYSPKATVGDLNQRYPLLRYINSYNSPMKDVVLYMNAAYAARKDN